KLILRCLRKDPSRRYQTMADLKVALEDLQTETSVPQAQPAIAAPQRRMGIRRIVLFAAVLAAVVAIIFIGLRVDHKYSADVVPLCGTLCEEYAVCQDRVRIPWQGGVRQPS